MSEVKDIWCGHKLTNYMKEHVLKLTMKEFEKPVHERKSAYMLILEARENLWVASSFINKSLGKLTTINQAEAGFLKNKN